VANQDGDPTSVLEFCRRLIAARRGNDDLAVGSYRSLPSPEDAWAYQRGAGTVVLLNMSDGLATFEAVHGSITLTTEADFEGALVEGALALAPWSGAIVVA
jgi:glycosidase